jgi:predicted metalloendopeptidase
MHSPTPIAPIAPMANQLADPDAFYQALLDTHQGLSLQQSHALNARLVLILANQVGDLNRLQTALRAARDSADDQPTEDTP